MDKGYLKEHSKLGIYKLFYSKNKSAYRRQKEKLFINTLKSLSKISTSPYSLTRIKDDDVCKLIEHLRKTDKETTIANKISVLRQGLKYIGVDITVSVKSSKPKNAHQSKFYRVKEKVADIENTMFMRIAYLQLLSGFSYQELHNIQFEWSLEQDNCLSVRLSKTKIVSLYFKNTQVKNNFINTHKMLCKNVCGKYSLGVNSSNITSVKKDSYLAIRTLYFEELRLNRLSEFDVRSAGYKIMWENYFKERYFESQKQADFKVKLKGFRSLLKVSDNRTMKKYLGIV